ncbi:MAG: polysaccharide deacetylase family protein [Clostridiaceae bacterium]|jgi:peptidoglycan/xylan/chitin deacetylase (PgdA/CDA1 family)|nr:polysaccharide deacetylase family protein [Clostridiaceae bacterium]
MKAAKFRFFSANIIIVFTLFALCALVFYPTVDAASTKNPAYYNGNRDSDFISVMINVYGGTEFIEPMLEALTSRGVTATFFIGGCWADDNNDTVKAIRDAGCEIGNHGFFHRDHGKLGYEKNLEEIVVTDKLLTEILGEKPSNLFAPPSGSFNDNTFKAAASLNMLTVMWSKDTIDWRDHDGPTIFKRATTNAEGGDFVLMHPTEATAKVLPQILDYYAAVGLKVVSVSENLAL